MIVYPGVSNNGDICVVKHFFRSVAQTILTTVSDSSSSSFAQHFFFVRRPIVQDEILIIVVTFCFLINNRSCCVFSHVRDETITCQTRRLAQTTPSLKYYNILNCFSGRAGGAATFFLQLQIDSVWPLWKGKEKNEEIEKSEADAPVLK